LPFWPGHSVGRYIDSLLRRIFSAFPRAPDAVRLVLLDRFFFRGTFLRRASPQLWKYRRESGSSRGVYLPRALLFFFRPSACLCCRRLHNPASFLSSPPAASTIRSPFLFASARAPFLRQSPTTLPFSPEALFSGTSRDFSFLLFLRRCSPFFVPLVSHYGGSLFFLGRGGDLPSPPTVLFEVSWGLTFSPLETEKGDFSSEQSGGLFFFPSQGAPPSQKATAVVFLSLPLTRTPPLPGFLFQYLRGSIFLHFDTVIFFLFPPLRRNAWSFIPLFPPFFPFLAWGLSAPSFFFVQFRLRKKTTPSSLAD